MPSWMWVILFFFSVFLLGVWGLWANGDLEQNKGLNDLLYDLYSVLQLFVLESGLLEKKEGNTAWQLLAAALLAPVVTVIAFLQLIWRYVVDRFEAGLCRYFYRGHVVVCGVGQMGRIHINNCINAGKRVVAIDQQTDCGSLIPPETKRYRFIAGDASDPETLRKAGASRANAIVIFCGGDLNNLRLAEAISKALSGDSGSKPKIICCNSSPELTEQAFVDQRYNPDLDHAVRLFDPFEAAARHLMRVYPPDVYANLSGRPRIHLAIYGCGPLGKAVLLEAIGLCQMDGYPQPRFTVIGRDANDAQHWFESRYPEASRVCAVDFVECDPDSKHFFSDLLQDYAQSVSQHVICLEDASAIEPFGLKLDKALAETAGLNAPIVLGMMTGFEPASLADQAPVDHDSSVLRPFKTRMITAFGDNVSVLSWENVVAAERDRLAEKNQQIYLQQFEGWGGDFNKFSSPAAVEWDELPEQFRKSNRSAVDHLPFKMRSVGCAVVPGSGDLEIGQQALHHLAKSEHLRWCAERWASGWRYGTPRRDAALIHQDLVPWSELGDAARKKDEHFVKSLKDLLSVTKSTVRQICVIGVTGHRSREISRSNRSLCKLVEARLDDIKGKYPDHKFIITSALAEGADRLVAELAIKRLDAGLHVVLPLPLQLYLEDFINREKDVGQARSAASFDQFHDLLDQAQFAAVIPQKFGGFDDVANTDPNLPDPSPRQHQYAYCGAYLVQHCHELICIWDGTPSRGTGGTADVVGWRKAGAVPEEYRWTGLQVGPAVEMTDPVIVDFPRQ